MELIKPNIPQPLSGSATRRMSYPKPPLPPKPKIIPPKPQYLASANKLSFKEHKIPYTEVNVIRGRCGLQWDQFRPCKDPQVTSNVHKMMPSSSEMATDVTKHDKDRRSSVPLIQVSHPSDPSSTCLDLTTSRPSSVSGDEDSRCIIEKTCKNFIEITSKSSSDSSSLSLEDSDGEEFFSAKEDPPLQGSFLYTPSNSPSPSADNGHVNPNDDDAVKIVNNNNDNENSAECKRKKKAYLVAKEIATSEAVFVSTLKLLNEGFKRFLQDRGGINLSTEGKNGSRSDAIPEKDLDEIFKYLPNLQSLNEAISVDLALRITEWETHPKIADIIVIKGPFLKLYANYIMELEEHRKLLEECTERYPYFGECLKEFEKNELSRFIPVSRHMLTPMQRITKYKELMKQYLKYLPEDGIDYSDAVKALEIVENVAGHANEAIRELVSTT